MSIGVSNRRAALVALREERELSISARSSRRNTGQAATGTALLRRM
jgi:hypothetical protein